ncbi:MAG: DUF1579 family protein [Planctomycetes bacterium]|nr:DUF1579 family protein [Planctomycetota bacterium]
MHHSPVSLTVAVAAICTLSPFVRAQEGPPTPAPELKKLEPLIGNWAGSGTVADPTMGTDKWTAQSSYQWSHDGFWVCEDTTIHFGSMPGVLVFHAYIGWDAENRRYVTASTSNTGEVRLAELELLPDGSMMTIMTHWEEATFAERSVFKIDGDKMSHQIDFLMPQGDSMKFVDGGFHRVDTAAPGVLGAEGFAEPANESMQQLCRGAGVYDTKGTMVMMPGMPAMNIYGTDTFTARFGGKVLHGHTDGAAEGMPGKYAADVFWGWDKKRGCYTSVFVSNMGEVGSMEMRASEDGRQLISTMSGTMMGQPMAQRFVLDLDEKGVYTSGVGHTLMGTAPPFESFRATYKKK